MALAVVEPLGLTVTEPLAGLDFEAWTTRRQEHSVDGQDSGWSAYEKLVLDKLETLEARVDSVDEKVVLVRIDVAQLKVKSGMWGAAAGFVPALVTAMVVFLSGGS